MAFVELQNPVWTTSHATVVVSNETNTSIDGSASRIVWTDAVNRYATVTFDSVDLSDYEEISFYVFIKDFITNADIFRVTIDGNNYDFSRDDFLRGRWNHVLLDCSSMGAVTTMTITSLVDDLTILIDYIGYRKVSYDCDVDIIEALKAFINLDYDVSTTLFAGANSGDSEIYVVDNEYITDTSMLQIDDGAGTIETVELLSRPSQTEAGELSSPLTNSFSTGDTVRVICPVRSEDFDNLEPDPICGIVVHDMEVDKQMDTVKMKNASKIKEYLGALGLCIYIDCNSKKKLLKMAREFNRKYGEVFQFLLDGEQVDIYLDTSVYNDAILGSNHRMAYFYKLEPQPYLLANRGEITTFNLTVESAEYEE